MSMGEVVYSSITGAVGGLVIVAIWIALDILYGLNGIIKYYLGMI